MKFSWVLLFIAGIVICTYVKAHPGRQSWGGHGNDNWNRNYGGGNYHGGGHHGGDYHGGGHHWDNEGPSAASQAQSQALNVDIVANPDGTFGVSQSGSQAEAMAATAGGGSNRPGNGHGKGNNKGGGGGASVSQAQSQTVNVNIINAPKVTA